MSSIIAKYLNIQLLSFFFFCRHNYGFFFIRFFSTSANKKSRKFKLPLKSFTQQFFHFAAWSKARILYYANNWIYTTNHKRIAVNYFWFVILSGIFGMALATVIRLELAYPGVGVFAGDSLQYLSLATAHGVIMVFFMIIPLLSGAFANFLLPTQLGVHDVAFPRLNSAAFWFLPGGLVMLGQLVCLDRRYQRMNCFNIREVQSLLKRRFFFDLINSSDSRVLLDQTMLGLRFKTNNLSSIVPNAALHNNFGLTITHKFRVSVASIVDEVAPGLFYVASASLLSNTIDYFSGFWSTKSNLMFSFFSVIQNAGHQAISCKVHVHLVFTNFISFAINFLWLIYEILTSYTFNFFFKLVSLLLQFIMTLFHALSDVLRAYLASEMRHATSHVAIADKGFYDFYVYFYRLFFELSTWGFFNWQSIYAPTNFYQPIKALFSPTTFIHQIFNNSTPQHTTTLELNKTQILSFVFTSPHKWWLTSTTLIQSSTTLYSQNAVIASYSLFASTVNAALSTQPLWISSFSEYIRVTFNLTNEFLSYVLDTIKSFSAPLNAFFLNRNIHTLLTTWYIPVAVNHDSVGSVIPSYELINFKKAVSSFLFFLFGDQALFTSLNYGVYNFTIEFNYTPTTVFIFIQRRISPFLELIYFNLDNNLSTLVHLFNSFYVFIFNAKDFFFSLKNPVGGYLYSFSQYFNNSYASSLNKYGYTELGGQKRGLRFNNPLFKYEYKTGDYFPKFYQETFTYLLSTLAGLTGGLRTSPWFFTPDLSATFKINFNEFYQTATALNWKLPYNVHNAVTYRVAPTNSFYGFFVVLQRNVEFSSLRWISFNNLVQKYTHMFAGSSMQQRVYSNWRQLKFTRESWRCKLLSARHQKNLFRRYAHESGVFWSIEKNARDLLPGWAMITPFSSRTRFTAIGKVDVGVSAILLVLMSSIVSGVNFLVTYKYLSTLNNRKMRDARSFFTEGIMCSSWMMIAANPMLIIGLIMLLSDRHWQTSFFDYSGGGDTILFQHMFWFFGHPEVYIVVIPTFGFVNTLFSYYLRKRISARASLLYSIYTIAFLGFFVWGHHMYMVGLSHTTRMLFSTLTVMISVPAATKLMHWCVTLVNSSFHFELPLLFMLTYVFLFVSGGISGMCVAHTGMDVLFHDTFYVIGHFHVMFAGAAMFGSFGAFYFYFSAIFGVKYSRVYAYLHFTYYLLGQLLTVIPMFWLGYAGMPRRVLDYPAAFGGWHSIITAGHMLSVAGLISFFIMIFDSLRQAKAATRNNFGIMRYNTRLNFYLYEIARVLFTQRRGMYLYRYYRPTAFKLNGYYFSNYEHLETTLYSYTFNKKL